MGACAVPGMMDEEVGVIPAGLGDRLAAVCRYGPKTLWERRERVSCSAYIVEVGSAGTPGMFCSTVEPDLPGLGLSASLPSCLWTYRFLGRHLFPSCGLRGVQVRVCDGRGCTERQATIFGSSWNDGLGFKCNPLSLLLKSLFFSSTHLSP